MNRIPSRNAAVVVGFALALAVLGCPGADSSESFTLRADSTPIAATGRPTASMTTRLIVSDVAVAGDTIVIAAKQYTSTDLTGGVPPLMEAGADYHLVTGSSGMDLVLLISRDGGRTFVQRPLLPPENRVLSSKGGFGVMLAEGKAYALLPSFREVPVMTGSEQVRRYEFMLPAHLDLDTGQTDVGVEMNVDYCRAGSQGMLICAGSETVVRDGVPDGYGTLYWSMTDIAYYQTTGGNVAYNPSVGCTPGQIAIVDWGVFGICHTPDSRYCWFTVQSNSQDAPVLGACWPDADYPGGFLLPTERGMALIAPKGDHAVVHGIDWPKADLGTGQVNTSAGDGLHERYGRFIPLDRKVGDQTVRSLVRITPNGKGLALPIPSPCADPANCPSELVFLSEISPTRQLLVYDLRHDGRQTLAIGFAALIDPTAGLPSDTILNPIPASPLGKQCLAEEACFPESAAATDCLARFGTRRFPPGAADPELVRFLAADPRDCAGLKAADGALFAGPSTCPVEACDGDWAVKCLGPNLTFGTVPTLVNCRDLNGFPCRLEKIMGEYWASCAADTEGFAAGGAGKGCDEKARALDKATGMVDDCEAHGMMCQETCIVYPSPCPVGTTRTCKNDVAFQCFDRTQGGDRVTDCARQGLKCLDGACVTGVADEDPCTAKASCEGSVLTWCENQVGRRVDCAELGLGCAVRDRLGDERARCVLPD